MQNHVSFSKKNKMCTEVSVQEGGENALFPFLMLILDFRLPLSKFFHAIEKMSLYIKSIYFYWRVFICAIIWSSQSEDPGVCFPSPFRPWATPCQVRGAALTWLQTPAEQREPSFPCRWKIGKTTKILSVFTRRCIHPWNLNLISKISLPIKRFFSPLKLKLCSSLRFQN